MSKIESVKGKENIVKKNGNGHLPDYNGHHQQNADGGFALKLESASTSRSMSQRQFLMSIMQTQTLSKCLYIAAESGIALHVSRATPVSVSDLAKRLGYQVENLQRFLSYLASHGIFEEIGDGFFVGTEMSDLLRDDVPGNCRAGLRWAGAPPITQALHEMEHTLRTGQSAFEHANGAPMYDFLTRNPDYETMFDKAMPDYHSKVAERLAKEFDFSKYSKVVELGGGRGFFVKELLTRYPKLDEVILFERESVERNILPELRDDDRFTFEAGDFLRKEIGCDAELFVIINTMHNFGDDDVICILGNIAKAMKRSGDKARLLIVEYDKYCYSPNEPSNLARAVDIMMMYLFAGKQRNETAWRSLLLKTNLTLVDDSKNNIIRLPPMFTAYQCKLI